MAEDDDLEENDLEERFMEDDKQVKDDERAKDETRSEDDKQTADGKRAEDDGITGDRYYRPREDSYLLLDAASEEVRAEDRVLEVGCGSGVVISRIAEMDVGRVVATDVNPHAVRETRERDVDVVRTDLYSGIGAEFDLVLFNPPYLPATEDQKKREGDDVDLDWPEVAVTGGDTGRKVIEKFLAGLDRILSEGGRAILVVSTHTDVEEVEERCRKHGFSTRKTAREELFFESLYALKIF